jgi:DNA-binding MarR family transcriptional regulator
MENREKNGAGRCYDRRLPRGFTGIWTPGRMYLCRELSRPQMDLLVEIDALSTDEEDRGCWACDRYLGRFLGMHSHHVGKLVLALVEAGFLTRQVVEDASQPGGRCRFLKLTRKALDLWLPLDAREKSAPEREPEAPDEVPASCGDAGVPGPPSASCGGGVPASCPPMSIRKTEELYEEKQQQQYLEYMGDRASLDPDEKAAGKTAGKAAAACLDIKSASDRLSAEAAGETDPSLAAGLIETLRAWEMPEEIARGLVATHGPEAVRYWVDRADGTKRPAGFVRKMLSSGAPRASPAGSAKHEARSAKRDADAEAQAWHERTRAESRARWEGRPPTEDEWGQAMTSLAAMLAGAQAELERRGLLREAREPR